MSWYTIVADPLWYEGGAWFSIGRWNKLLRLTQLSGWAWLGACIFILTCLLSPQQEAGDGRSSRARHVSDSITTNYIHIYCSSLWCQWAIFCIYSFNKHNCISKTLQSLPPEQEPRTKPPGKDIVTPIIRVCPTTTPLWKESIQCFWVWLGHSRNAYSPPSLHVMVVFEGNGRLMGLDGVKRQNNALCVGSSSDSLNPQ